LSSDDKPEQRPTPPPPGTGKEAAEGSSPSLDELDSSWGDDEVFDEDATMVAKVPLDLVALSRRGSELQEVGKKVEEPEKHEAVTARPPPMVEASVVVDAPHEQLPPGESRAKGDDDDDDEDDDDNLVADDLDAGWDIEEERAAAADVAAGLDAEARRRASEARAQQRKERARAKTLAAKEKRRARADEIRRKQKKPKKRSIPPPPRDAPGAIHKAVAKAESLDPPASRERPTLPPEASRVPDRAALAKRDTLRMVLFVAVVVVIGALTIGVMHR
jgi:hypothetical protein